MDVVALVVVNTDVAPVVVADIGPVLGPDCVVENKEILIVEEVNPDDSVEVCSPLVIETDREVDVDSDVVTRVSSEELVEPSIGLSIDEKLVVELEAVVRVVSEEVPEGNSVVGGGVEVEEVSVVGMEAQLEEVGALVNSLLLLVIQSPQLGGVDRRRDLDSVNQRQ